VKKTKAPTKRQRQVEEEANRAAEAIVASLVETCNVWRPFVTLAKQPGQCYYTEGHIVAVYQEKDGTWGAFTGPDPKEAEKPKKLRAKVPPSPIVMRAFHLTSEDDAKTVAMNLRLMVACPSSVPTKTIVEHAREEATIHTFDACPCSKK
jgi:hypothetical protein